MSKIAVSCYVREGTFGVIDIPSELDLVVELVEFCKEFLQYRDSMPFLINRECSNSDHFYCAVWNPLQRATGGLEDLEHATLEPSFSGWSVLLSM